MLNISSFIAKRTGQETDTMILDGGLYEQMLSIVRRMAFSPLKQYCEYGSVPACLYCSWTALSLSQETRTAEEFHERLHAEGGVQHAPGCPVKEAQHLLFTLADPPSVPEERKSLRL